MNSGRAPSVSPPLAPAIVDDGFDELTARSALRSLSIAALVIAVPAIFRPDVAWYYLAQTGALLVASAILWMTRRFMRPQTVARFVLGVSALLVATTSWLSGGASSAAFHAYSVALVGGTWLVLPLRAALGATAGVVGFGAMLAVATTRQWIPAPWVVHGPWSVWLTISGAALLIALVQWLEVHRLRASNAAVTRELDRSEAAQRQLASSEQRYAEIVSTAPGVVCEFEVRPDGTRAFTFMSEGARRLFDCPPADILASAQVLFDMIETPTRHDLEAAITRSSETLTALDIEGAVKTRAGQVKWAHARALPTRQPDGTMRWHGVITDLSERLKAEQALRESQQALKQSLSMIQGAFESTADGLLVVDTAGRANAYNQKFLSLWRVPEVIARTYDAEQLRAHVARQVVGSEEFLARVKQIYADPDAVSFDTLALADGRQYERYSQPQVVDGAVVGRVWSFRDVTVRASDDRRRADLEQALQQAHTLEALGTLAGGIAHDFNNLLTIILGNAEQAALDVSPAAQHASLAAITRAAERAGALVREIREFSQPRATERAVVTVSDTIGTAVQLLRTTMPKSIALEVRLDPSVTMFTNATQLQQVVTNLVLNAGQAIGDASGRIDVVLDDVGAAEAPDATPRPLAARYARLTVSDTGLGISADAMPRIFEPFFTTRRDTTGTGLGLAVVNGIVRRYHGIITVDSAPGCGTTFRVFWPALPPAAATPLVDAPAAQAVPGQAPGRGRHILVVDDEPDIVKVIAEGLRRMGYQVTTATDPRDALAIFAARPADIDAVLSDLSMPHLSGAALGRRMLDLRPDTPIVLFTGYSAELSPDEARAAGFRAVLNKPMSLSVLAEWLHRVLPESATA
ncbi:MAG: response regulator [Acidobacteria bacterium]|nr:response regulator [Acidobacteriota bacterium]